MIKLNNVSLVYNENLRNTHAISNINLEINKSDFIVVLGPSGCGKSSLLKLIAGFIKPSNGKVLKNNVEILAPGHDRGVVFQSTNLYPWLNVEDNIKYGLKIAKTEKHVMNNLVDEYLEKTKLLEYRKHYPFELSGGMQQRVALSRTLITSPDIVLMDEPFGALDAITRSSMQAFIRKMWFNESQTFFMITHDIDEALKLANRVIVMSKSPGTIIKEFKINYYEKLIDNPYEIIENDDEYIRIKHEILKIINS
ncbi:ABC transporter ATP-binding protein [Helcococcus ovis]|uniref:ABC transporter ATP-binding protein n=2 Tax=Helcococcus ovis TaxID=72026 RepID=A0A4R9C1P2_9FIRM|nr:ABC transporter ATP-binding protein [Helcococcus ovis]TFF64582.1 ABC transporter ATP-binding protein [Helcococcus ovis]TFF65392.1 ABC transporter ATP-binding protein [Helcococcus ovis]TFF68448.1 ABC transporter ATP-binding protein [Helcococcus ovis]WNZ00503.1 ABC transporter ATP-binding protein [Helcococcus ovis]